MSFSGNRTRQSDRLDGDGHAHSLKMCVGSSVVGADWGNEHIPDAWYCRLAVIHIDERLRCPFSLISV